jgi:hypothetical protein
MSPHKQVVIKLTDQQRQQLEDALGKEVTFVIFRLLGGSQVIAEVSDASDTFDGRC